MCNLPFYWNLWLKEAIIDNKKAGILKSCASLILEEGMLMAQVQNQQPRHTLSMTHEVIKLDYLGNNTQCTDYSPLTYHMMTTGLTDRLLLLHESL